MQLFLGMSGESEKVKVTLFNHVWLCDPMDYSLPVSSVHGIFQARVLEWAAISFSRGSFQPRDWTHISCISSIAGRVFYHLTTWEAPVIIVQFSSVTQSCLTLCDPMDCSTPGLPVQHQQLELTQTHVHWVGDAIQPPQPLPSPSPPTFNLSQHQHSINSSLKWLHLSRSPLCGSTFFRPLVSNYSDEKFSQLPWLGYWYWYEALFAFVKDASW